MGCNPCSLFHQHIVVTRHLQLALFIVLPSSQVLHYYSSLPRCKSEKVTDSIHPRRIGWRDCGRLFQGKPPPPQPWGWFGEGVFIWAEWEAYTHTVSSSVPHTDFLFNSLLLVLNRGVFNFTHFNEVNRSSRRSAISTEWNAPLSSTEADSMLHTWNWIYLFSENKKHRQEIEKTK